MEGMLTQQELRSELKRQNKAGKPWFHFGLVAGVIGAVSLLIFKGTKVPDWMLVLPVLACLVAGSVLDHLRSTPVLISCPTCRRNLSLWLELLRFSGRCPHCKDYIVEGRPRSLRAYDRYWHRQFDRVLRPGVWVWAALLLGLLLWGQVNTDGLNLAILAAWPGVIVAGFSWLRTGSRHYLWPFLVSSVIALLAHLCLR